MKNEIIYLKRDIDSELYAWRNEPRHKPLLLRGARQVGKSSAVRNLAREFDYFLEVNFEEQADTKRIFDRGNLSPQVICEKLTAQYDIPVIPGKTLLFLDEIQECIPAISSLRFFYEKMSDLHVIAAGSLLEFALGELPSFGVGRIRSMFMYPFSFYEFLNACGHNLMLKAIQNANVNEPLDEVIHKRALYQLKLFLIMGGMPEVVATYAAEKDLYKCQRVLDDLMISLRNDFTKYKKRVPSLQISAAFNSVIEQTGRKFVYSRTGQEYSLYQMKQAVELLIMAGLVIPVVHTAANGLPLGAEINHKRRKMLLLDTGLLQRLLGLQLSDILMSDDFDFVNKGNIAELYVGLELLKSVSCYEQTQLYYWQREEKNSHAEVDYIVQRDQEIVPVEVKSGKQGKMQSLYLFLTEKNIPSGVRTSLENYSQYGKTHVIPLYAAAELIK